MAASSQLPVEVSVSLRWSTPESENEFLGPENPTVDGQDPPVGKVKITQ